MRRGASATQASLGRMGAHARRVWQASTKQTREVISARIVLPASLLQQLGQHQIHVATAAQAKSQEKVPVHARTATTANTKTKEAKPHALTAGPESFRLTSMKRNLDALIALLDAFNPWEERTRASTNVVQVRTRWPAPLRAQHVRPTRTRLKPVGCWRAADATQATAGRMGALARVVWQASTRRHRVAPTVQIVWPASMPQQWRQHPIHVATVRQARFQQQMVPLHARIATTETSKMSQDKPHAKRAGPESLQAMTTMQGPPAHIALLASTNRIQEKLNASHAFLARINRPRDKTCV